MPPQFLYSRVPVKNIENCLLRILCQELLAPMVLGDLECLIAVYFQITQVEGLSRAVCGIEGILGAMVYTSRVGYSRPRKHLCFLAGSGSENTTPKSGFAVMTMIGP